MANQNKEQVYLRGSLRGYLGFPQSDSITHDFSITFLALQTQGRLFGRLGRSNQFRELLPSVPPLPPRLPPGAPGPSTLLPSLVERDRMKSVLSAMRAKRVHFFREFQPCTPETEPRLFSRF